MSENDVGSFIDFQRNKRVTTQLTTKEGESIKFTDALEQVQEFISNQLKAEGINSTKHQIYPLVAQTLVNSLSGVIGDEYAAAFLLSQPGIRHSIIIEMLTSFYLQKFIQKNELKIVTEEEDITQEQCDQAQRLDRASAVFAIATYSGIEPLVIAQAMLEAGTVTKEDLIVTGFTEEQIAIMLEDINENSGNS